MGAVLTKRPRCVDQDAGKRHHPAHGRVNEARLGHLGQNGTFRACPHLGQNGTFRACPHLGQNSAVDDAYPPPPDPGPSAALCWPSSGHHTGAVVPKTMALP
jgi:hypothetical protein